MPDVAKKVLSVHFRRMVANERGTRKGEDIERLHAMRVSVRRMRTAARIFGRFLDADEFEPFTRELRALGRTLGPVRDLDVMMDHARRFRETAPMRERYDMDTLLRDWQDRRARLRGRLLERLNAPAYGRFKRDFPVFLEDASAGVLSVLTKSGRVRPSLLSHEGPVVLYEHLAAVRAYDGWLTGDDVPLRRYHRLRIEVKRLRYALEFLADVTGPEAEPLVTSLKAVQDHLGEMREAWMTADLLEREFLRKGGAGSKTVSHPGIALYMASRRDRCEELRGTFAGTWTTVNNPEFHRRIAAIAAAF
ncbi:MAG TPA: CHAD domain-containing protein [Thermoplasmata archaeon]|nr:CHAD domain-containing protein [Thermoplasmata archaeon]